MLPSKSIPAGRGVLGVGSPRVRSHRDAPLGGARAAHAERDARVKDQETKRTEDREV